MNSSDPKPSSEPNWRELAELYRLGLLTEQERASFEAYLKREEAADDAARSANALGASLGLSAPGVPLSAAPKGIRESLVARARQMQQQKKTQVWKSWQPAADAGAGEKLIVAKDDGGWVPIDVPGITVRRLFVDEKENCVTMLVKMGAGASYPPHRHGGDEECYVLEGDLHVGDRHMVAGDYQWSGAGSEHGVQSSKSGCLLFIRSSMADELL
jgi:quercetin dioxygenase-like cupin family protein